MRSFVLCVFCPFFASRNVPIRSACTAAIATIILSAFLQAPVKAQAQTTNIITFNGEKYLLKNGAKFSRQRDEFYCAERDDPFMIRNFADYDGRNDPMEYRFVVGCRSEEIREQEYRADGVSSNTPGTEGPPDGDEGPGEPQ